MERLTQSTKESSHKPLGRSILWSRALIYTSLLLISAACAPSVKSDPQKDQDIEQTCKISIGDEPFAKFGFDVTQRGYYPPNMSNPREVINSNIHLVYSDGLAVNLTNNPDMDESDPALSENGREIVFSRLGSVKKINEDLWVHIPTGLEGLYTMRVDGSEQQRVTFTEPEIYDKDPSWSADSQKIAFIRRFSNQNVLYEVFIVNRDGSDLTKLTDFGKDPTNAEPFVANPKFSPDGKKIAFRGRATVFVIDLDENIVKKVSRGDDIDGPHGSDDNFWWSKDNKTLKVYRVLKLSDDPPASQKKTVMAYADGRKEEDITSACPFENAFPDFDFNWERDLLR